MIGSVLMVVGGCFVGGLAALGAAVLVKVFLLFRSGPVMPQAALNAAQARIAQAQKLLAEEAAKARSGIREIPEKTKALEEKVIARVLKP